MKHGRHGKSGKKIFNAINFKESIDERLLTFFTLLFFLISVFVSSVIIYFNSFTVAELEIYKAHCYIGNDDDEYLMKHLICRFITHFAQIHNLLRTYDHYCVHFSKTLES